MPIHRPTEAASTRTQTKPTTSRARQSRSRRFIRSLPAVLSSAALMPLAGCMAYSHSERDVDRTPIVNIGSRASIIYPGQSIPGFPTLPPPPGGAAGQSSSSNSNGPNGQSGQSQQYGAPTGQQPPVENQTQYPPPGPGAGQGQPAYGGSPPQQSDPNAGMTMLGGAREDITKHTSIREDPLFMKYMTAPLAIVAAPFVLAKEALMGEPEPGPAVPRPPNPTTPTTPTTTAVQSAPSAPATRPPSYEERMMNSMAKELADRQKNQKRQASAVGPEATYASRAASSELSIEAELEALRRTPDAPRRGPESAPQQATRAPHSSKAPSQQASAPSNVSETRRHRTEPKANPAVADGIVDRNDDGRIDQWIYRKDGEIVREERDEDFNGHVDRIIHTDLATHDVHLVEEDNGGKGRIDTWTDYRDGSIARRRADSNGNGAVDTWSFYRAGELVRHEQDTTHDGFRDAITFYAEGRRVRETRDLDEDGEPEIKLFYNERDQVVRQEEDADGNGKPEVISHYENGRLKRRELLDVPKLAGQQSDEQKTR